MRRTIAMLSVMGTMLLLASGVALALNQVDCTTSTDPADGICYGTTKSDVILGTEFNDTIYALAGSDTVNGGLGDDSIFGHRGADTSNGGEGVDYLFGGDGNDTLDLRDTTVVPTDSYEFANGGNGNDTIYADDGQLDLITCGPGKKDTVTYDQYDLFSPYGDLADSTSTPSADCENATLVNR